MTDLPSLEQPQAYVVVGPEDQRGPYTLELLITEVVDGRLNEATPVWWPGLTDWTTMSTHPGLAAEIARRRNPTPAPPAASPPGQYQQADYGYGQSGGGYPAASAPGQDFSTGSYTGADTLAAQADVSPEPAEEPVAEVSVVDQPITEHGQPVEAQEATQMAGETVEAGAPGEDAGVFGVGAAPVEASDAVEVPAVEVTPADFAAVDANQTAYRASGAAEGLDPAHGAAFAEMIRRSRARADAAAIVESVDSAFVDAVDAAAAAQGLAPADRSDQGDAHELSFRSGEDTLSVSLGKVTGHAMAVREGEIALDVSATSTTYGGGADAGTGEHGEIVVTTAEHGGASVASVSLVVPLADYLDEDMSTDDAAMRRNMESVIVSVRHRLS